MSIRTAHLIVLAVLVGAAVPAAAAWDGDFNLLLAGKRLNDYEWGPTDRQGELGLQTNWRGQDWPVALAADLLFSGRDRGFISSRGFTEQSARTSELDLGARKIWRPGPNARPYFGGGLAIVSGELELRGPPGVTVDRDDGAGVWLGGGIFWTLGSAFNLGLDAKITAAGVRLFGVRRNAGGLHLGLLLGYHWGG